MRIATSVTTSESGEHMQDVIKHPFRVMKLGGSYCFQYNFYRNYMVYNEVTNEDWRYFESRRDAYEYAYFMNGNIKPYNRKMWY